MKLCLLGQYEIFGLDEIADNFSYRKTTVRCITNDSLAYFIKKDDFINCVN